MKNMTIDLSNRPVITVMEASQLLGLSPTSVKRRIFEGRLKALKRDNLYEKMVDAYKITVYRKGGIQPGQKQQAQQQPVAEVAPVRKPDPNAAKQALVSGGEMAPNMPTLNLQEMSYDDILARGEHLLDL